MTIPSKFVFRFSFFVLFAARNVFRFFVWSSSWCCEGFSDLVQGSENPISENHLNEKTASHEGISQFRYIASP